MRPPSGTSRYLGGLHAGACKRCGGWFGPNFSAPARVRSSKDGPPAVTRACCLRAASQWRLAVVCILSKVVSKVLRSSAFGLCRCRSTGCAYGCHLLRAVRIGRMGICVHSTLWQQARIGMQPDVASGRCVQLRLCPTRLPRGHRKITRSNTKATSDLHSKEDQQIMQSHDNTAKAHIGAESSSARSSIAKRALQQAKALRRSEITHFRWSPAFGCLVHPMQASSRWDPTRGDSLFAPACPGNGFSFQKKGTGIQFFFRPRLGVSGDQPIRPPPPPTNSVRACPQRT